MIPNVVVVQANQIFVTVIILNYIISYDLIIIACRGNNRKNITYNCECEEGFFDNGG